MASLLDRYRSARQKVRGVVPLAARQVARSPFLNPLYGLEQVAGAFIPGPGQTGGDYLPSYFSGAVQDNRQGPGGAYPIAGGGSMAQDEGSLFADLGVSGGVSGGGEGYTPDYRILNGVYYDINNPDERNAYFNSYQSALQSEYSQQIEALNQSIGDIDTRQRQYGQQAVGQIKGLGEGYDLGTVRRGQYFAGLSPNAYQSSQGTSQQYALGKLREGVGSIQQGVAEAGQQFSKQKENIAKEQSALVSEYQNTLDQLAQNLVPLDQNSSGRLMTTRVSQYNPLTPTTTDLASYTPYTTFQQNVPGNVPMSGGTYQPQEDFSYLGYTPSEEEQNYIRKYLRGYA